MKEIITPGILNGAADFRRGEFDVKNEIIINHDVDVKAVFIGDPITHLWELQAYFDNLGIILNRGIGGDISRHVLVRFDADVIQVKPRACVMLIGINDTWSMEEKGKESDEDLVSSIVNNIARTVDKGLLNGIAMFVCSLLPVEQPDHARNKDRKELIIEANRRIEEVCMVTGAVYCNLHSLLVSKDGISLREGLSRDGLHPHVQGYDIMAELISKKFRENRDLFI